MRLAEKVIYFQKDPKILLKKSLLAIMRSRGVRQLISDKLFLKCNYRWETGKSLDLQRPITFNEKLQWLKLNDRNPAYTCLVDKYCVREYVSKAIGEQYLIPLIALYNNTGEIEWDMLPDKFVLKCTHASGTNIICSNKTKLDVKNSVRKLNKWMRMNYFWRGREWPYKDVKPRIICEQYMVDESGVELKDYKIFCFNGEPKLIQVDHGRFSDHRRNLYDTSWNYLDATIKHRNFPNEYIKKPDKLEEMLQLAKTLAGDYPHVRVDFYSINQKLYFGELTFYHGSGHEEIKPDELGVQMGNWIKIPNESEKNK